MGRFDIRILSFEQRDSYWKFRRSQDGLIFVMEISHLEGRSLYRKYAWSPTIYSIGLLSNTENAHAPGTFSPPPRFSDPDMHHGICATHVPWCMSGSLTSGFLSSRWRGKRFQHSRRMRNPHFYVSGKRPMGVISRSETSTEGQWVTKVVVLLAHWHITCLDIQLPHFICSELVIPSHKVV